MSYLGAPRTEQILMRIPSSIHNPYLSKAPGLNRQANWLAFDIEYEIEDSTMKNRLLNMNRRIVDMWEGYRGTSSGKSLLHMIFQIALKAGMISECLSFGIDLMVCSMSIV